MKTKQRLEEEKRLIQIRKEKQMKIVAKKKKIEVMKVSAGNDSMFFRGEFSGPHTEMTDKQWVKYMNKKHGFKWTGRD